MKSVLFILLICIIFISFSSVNALEDTNQTLSNDDCNSTLTSADSSKELETKINIANNGDTILINKGTYKIHNIKITKNLTLQGNGNPRDIIIDGEEKSGIFLIRNPNVHITFKNITFINGLTHNFGGAISIETGNVHVDNCIFINNTALNKTNAGAISNYGNRTNRGYLFVNNSIFINNHADHDGGAVTTCYADSDIYNCVFINNTAIRDGGAIRVSVFGYGNVQDCIFMFNHADEWGGAYYSWSGESNIERCIFMNNTAGTNGGAVMVSGNINIESSIIVNNEGGETGGSFYIQQPMYNTKTVINVHNNIITNNSSPYGKEIFIDWDDSYNLYTQFDDNDWGDEDPNDSSINDPDNVTPRSKVSSVITSTLFDELSVNLLDKYNDLIRDFFPDDSLGNLKKMFKLSNVNNQNTSNSNQETSKPSLDSKISSDATNSTETVMNNLITNSSVNSQNVDEHLNSPITYGNSTSHGENEKAYELNEVEKSIAKKSNLDIKYLFVIVIVLILLSVGYIKNKK